ncbi:TraR/DksA C4-type zinc finger protein [uncultured Abyssibacter sp.]|uniref:TraR/DksA family transcriptional regulator n=1 Tax=uncultured Abyssibacter sp. TaxID=2320202 RepID=UPI0032B13793
MTDATTEERLKTRRGEMTERLTAIRADYARGRNDDWEEQAVERENDETLAALEQQALDAIGRIDHALERLRSGDYGICEACGGLIEPARLKTLPEVSLCAACAAVVSGG